MLKWKKKKQPSFLATHTAKIMEYILVYAKNKDKLEKLSIDGTTDSTKKVINISNNKSKRHFMKGVRVKGESNQIIPAGVYTIRTMSVEYKQDIIVRDNYTINDIEVEANFSVSQDKIDEFIKNDLLFITAQKGLRRDVSSEEIGKRKSITDLLLSEWGDNQESDKEFLDIFDEKYFDYIKPINLIKNLVKCNFTENEIILDFFSESATTAHSVMKLNSEDYGNRKYIMVQIPENTEENSKAYNSGYKNICQIGKDRIRKAGDKIVSENKDKEGIENLDIGFKVFKLEYNCGGEKHSMMKEGIKVDIIKRPKDKPICKFKVDGELYYLVKTNEDIIVFPYKSSIKGKAIASIFNIKLCKNKDYMQLEYLYNMKLNEFNGEDFIHSQYVTSVILDNVYKNLNE